VNIGSLDFLYRPFCETGWNPDVGGVALEGGFVANGNDPCDPGDQKAGVEYVWIQVLAPDKPLGGRTPPIVAQTIFCVGFVISPLVTGQTVVETGAVNEKLPTILNTEEVTESVPLSVMTSLRRMTTLAEVVVGTSQLKQGAGVQPACPVPGIVSAIAGVAV
jgi:hypothetical protein